MLVPAYVCEKLQFVETNCIVITPFKFALKGKNKDLRYYNYLQELGLCSIKPLGNSISSGSAEFAKTLKLPFKFLKLSQIFLNSFENRFWGKRQLFSI